MVKEIVSPNIEICGYMGIETARFRKKIFDRKVVSKTQSGKTTVQEVMCRKSVNGVPILSGR